MLKFFGNSDLTTPKASATERNPFDSLQSPSRKSSVTSLFTASGSRTPTHTKGSFHSSSLAGPSSVGSAGFFGSQALGDGGKGDITPGASTFTPGGVPTTAISLAEPDFSFKTLPPAARKKDPTAGAPRGKLSVKLIEGRNLGEGRRSYVVVTFDSNEFVSRESVGEEELEQVGEISSKVPVVVEPPSQQQQESISGGSGIAKSLQEYKRNTPPTTPAGVTESPMKIDRELLPIHNPIWKHEVFFDVMSETSPPLTFQIFDRLDSIEEEAFLGMVEIRPRLVNGLLVDQWFALESRSDEHVTGEIRVQVRYEKFDTKKGLSVNDFSFLRMIGKGTFGRVFQVRKKDTHRIYAMKVLSKREIVAKKEVAHTIGERKILQTSSQSPFLLGLKFSFQSETDLYLIMDYKSGGELFHHLQKEGRFTEDRARFYTAEIVLAFEHLHKFDIVYRDLKPENILLDATGHIVLCDFGLSKPDLPSDALTNTFCGTTEYLAPEVLLDDHGYSKLVDFWSLGVLLFEMCCGWSPFYAEDTQQMYKLICFGKVKFPRGVIGEDGKQFVKGLLNRNPKHRLGAVRDTEELKEHAFFKSIDWEALSLRQIPPPFKPYVDSDESVANFDPEFTEANLLEEAPDDVDFLEEEDRSEAWLTRVGSQKGKSGTRAVKIRPKRDEGEQLSSSVQENFRGFTFSGSGEGESFLHPAGGLSMTSLTMRDD